MKQLHEEARIAWRKGSHPLDLGPRYRVQHICEVVDNELSTDLGFWTIKRATQGIRYVRVSILAPSHFQLP